MILTADVLSRLAQCERGINVSCNNVDASTGVSGVSAVEDRAQQTNSDDVATVNNDDRSAVVIDESVDCDRDELSDDVGDDNESDVGTNTHNEPLTDDTASCQHVAEEQRSDETLKGCFKLAKAGKGGFELHDNLLYHRKTVTGDSILQLVVPLSRRKHVLELGHDVFGGHMAFQRTKQRIEFTFIGPL